MEVALYILIAVGVLWALISGIIAIIKAWRICMLRGESSSFMPIVFSEIGGNWIAVLGILLLCIPVWIILSIVVSGKTKKFCPPDGRPVHVPPPPPPPPAPPQNVYQPETKRFQPDMQPVSYRTQITLGKSASCDIRVDGRYEDVSREHAVISMQGNSMMLTDKSTNGSYVNGQYVHNRQYFIRPGDRIVLGKSYMLSWNEINSFFN